MKIEKTSAYLLSAHARESVVSTQVARVAKGADLRLGMDPAQLRSMESDMVSSQLVNAAKIAEIKQAISEGYFQINFSLVADSLIRFSCQYKH